MRVLVQRVSEGSVRVDGETVGAIGRGCVLLVGVGEGDGEAEADKLADKVARLRIFPNDEGRYDRSLLDIGGEALVVSQFTLYGDARKGRRPSFVHAAPPGVAEPLVACFARKLEALGVAKVATGRFGAMMDVLIRNDGPTTLWLDSAEL